MSDEIRNEAGQFASSEPLTGQAGVEADQGFRPMKQSEEDRPEPESDIRTEAARLKASRAQADDPVIPIQYQRLDSGEQAPLNETVSLEKAADDLGAYHGAQDEERARSVSSDFAKEVDALRADALKQDPELAKDLGLSKEDVAAAAEAANAEAEVETAVKAPVEPAAEADLYADIPGLEPATREALKTPQVRQFLEQAVAETSSVKEAYSAGLNNAQQFAQASLVALAPELAQVPIDRWAEAVNIIAKTDPVRGQQLGRVFQNVAALNERQQLVANHEQSQRQYQFEAVKQQYNRESDKVLGPMTHAERAQAAEDLVNYLGEHGVSREQLLHESQTNLMLSHPAFNALAMDALKYRAMQKATKPIAHKNLPPVSRPGTSVHRSSGDNSSQIATLRSQISSLTGDKAVRAAAKLAQLQRKG